MPLQAALENTAKAASKRAAEGQKLFGPVATFLDEYLSSTTNLPPHLLSALNALSTELSVVAQRHFNAFITGSTTMAAPDSAQASKPPSPPPSRPSSGLAQSTYALVAGSPTLANKPPKPSLPKKGPLKKPTPDNRLFVRLPNGHEARQLHGYLILVKLRNLLGPGLLREVQATRTGFALCPTSPDALKSLEDKRGAISDFFGGCLVERGSHWVSYRITNVPRQIGHHQVTPDAMIRQVTQVIGVTPVSVTETKHSASNPTLPYTCWFVNFPEGSPVSLVPRQPRLFGVVATATFLPRKSATIQCNRCWMWHNARSCARLPRCRLWGSTKHSEEGHSNCCDTPTPHLCPPRCVHCFGPHPADSIDCPLRPRAGNPPTRVLRSELRASGAAEYARTKVEAGCSKSPAPTSDPPATPSPTGQMAADTTIVVLQPSPTPPPHSPPRAAPPAKRIKRSNRFDVLAAKGLGAL